MDNHLVAFAFVVDRMVVVDRMDFIDHMLVVHINLVVIHIPLVMYFPFDSSIDQMSLLQQSIQQQLVLHNHQSYYFRTKLPQQQLFQYRYLTFLLVGH